jgi:hypothetical protein
MFRIVFCWPLLLVILPWSANATEDSDLAEPVPQSCVAGERREPPVFEPVENRPLTDTEQRDLETLFEQLAGEWRGTLDEQVCMLNGSVKQYGSTSTLKARETGDGLTMRGDDTRREGGAKRVHKRSFHITAEGLRVDARSALGDIEPLKIADDGLAFMRRYRTLHQRGESAPEPQPEGGVLVQRVEEDGSLTTVGVLPAVPVAEPPKRRFSTTREERYYLQLSGGNELTLTQQFFTQGVYSGTKSWRLQRD